MKPLDTETNPPRPNRFARWLRRLARPRYRTQIAESQTDGGRKLEPIAEILARSGREQGAAD